MRQVAFALLVTSVLLAAGCNQSPEGDVQGNGVIEPLLYAVTPGLVTGDRTGGINGSFKITQAGDGIPSDLFGGACIMFRAEDLNYSSAGKSCNNDSQCKAAGAIGDCHPDTHVCWARPAADPDPLCRRSRETHAPWPPDTDNAIGFSGPIAVPTNLKPNAQAVVVACLRGAGSPGDSDADPASTACGQPKSIVRWGSPTTIH